MFKILFIYTAGSREAYRTSLWPVKPVVGEEMFFFPDADGIVSRVTHCTGYGFFIAYIESEFPELDTGAVDMLVAGDPVWQTSVGNWAEFTDSDWQPFGPSPKLPD